MVLEVKPKKTDYGKMTDEELWEEYEKKGGLELKQELELLLLVTLVVLVLLLVIK